MRRWGSISIAPFARARRAGIGRIRAWPRGGKCEATGPSTADRMVRRAHPSDAVAGGCLKKRLRPRCFDGTGAPTRRPRTQTPIFFDLRHNTSHGAFPLSPGDYRACGVTTRRRRSCAIAACPCSRLPCLALRPRLRSAKCHRSRRVPSQQIQAPMPARRRHRHRVSARSAHRARPVPK